MTDLTEKWKKGELPEGWHYVKDIHNKERHDRYFKETNNFEYLEDWEVGEVLAEVPDYVEWRNMVNCACEEHEANKLLIEENAQLKEEVENCEFIIKSRESEIVKLKELLKECKYELRGCYTDIGWEDQSLINKINQVLGEDE